MKKSSPPPPGFGSPRRRSSISRACTPTKRSPLSRLEQAPPKRKRYDRSGPTTKGSPSEDGSQACHSDVVHIEQNCRARKKSEIVDDTKDDPPAISTCARTAARATARLPARAPEAHMQGLRHGILPARAPEEPVNRLRHGLLPARTPGWPVQGLQAIGNRQQTRQLKAIDN
jgi:hypothetical protein